VGCAVDLGIERKDGAADSSLDPGHEDFSDADPPPDVIEAHDPAVEDGPPPSCGNGEIEAGEECDSDPDRSCTTGCGSTGAQTCVDCAWAACVPPVEICNGADDDCDDLTDEVGTISAAGGPVRVSVDPAVSRDPHLAWDDSGFGIVWVDGRTGTDDLFSAVVSETGSVLASEARLLVARAAFAAPSAAWDGARYKILATDDPGMDGNPDVVLLRMNALGEFVAPVTLISSSGGVSLFRPTIALMGGWSGMAWDSGSAIWFARLNPAGSKVGGDVEVDGDPGPSHDLDLAASSDRYALAWVDERDGNAEIYAAVLDPGGTAIAAPVRLTEDPAPSSSPSIAWDGSDFVVAWSDAPDGAAGVYVTRLSVSGVEEGGEVLAMAVPVGAGDPCVLWTGSLIGIAWSERMSGEDDVRFTVLDPSGEPLADAVTISPAGGSSLAPAVSWSGSRFGIAWQDDRDGNPEIYLASAVFVPCP